MLVEPVGDAADDPADKRHLIILVNGLFGSADNWEVVVECLQVQCSCETIMLCQS